MGRARDAVAARSLECAARNSSDPTCAGHAWVSSLPSSCPPRARAPRPLKRPAGTLDWEISFERGLLATSRNTCRGCGARLLAAAPGFRGPFGSFADQFHAHQAGDEFLRSDAVEINRSALDVGFSHDSKSILAMLDALSFGKNLHNCLLVWYPATSEHFLRGASPPCPARGTGRIHVCQTRGRSRSPPAGPWDLCGLQIQRPVLR
jgi:hypothetical protein